MIVVMASAATEAEILGVKSRILAEGLTPFDHAGDQQSVISGQSQRSDPGKILFDLSDGAFCSCGGALYLVGLKESER